MVNSCVFAQCGMAPVRDQWYVMLEEITFEIQMYFDTDLL